MSTGDRPSILHSLRNLFSLTPGLIDSGLSALAGFATSLYAVRFLDGPALGAYGLYLAAVTVASLVPQQLLFLPSQVAALAAPRRARLSLLRPTLLPGLALSLLTLPFVAPAGLILGGQVPREALVALAAGAALLVLAGSPQDHVRSTLYLADAAPWAAAVSGVQLVATAIAIGALDLAGASAAWVPLAAQAAGCAASMLFGLGVVAAMRPRPLSLPALTTLMRSGASLLPSAAIQEATVFLSAALLGTRASAGALGSSEAARVVARPVQVVSLGISRSLAPRLMEAGQSRSRAAATGTAWLYTASLMGSGLVYFVIAGWPHALNPLQALAPAAFETQGLVALFLLATVLGAVSQVPRAVLLGARLNRDLLYITVVASVVRLAAVALLAPSIDAYAVPVALILGAIVTGVLGLRTANRILEAH